MSIPQDVNQPRGTHPVMAALAARVPLTLLADLADPAGPDSRRILASEVADLSWLRDLAYPTGPAGLTVDVAGERPAV